MAKTSIKDFRKVVHGSENNKFSQKNLDKHRYKFTGQALAVLEALKNGENLSDDYARKVYKIRHIGRRICDLGESGIDIDREWALKAGEQQDYIVYFLPKFRAKFTKMKRIIKRGRWWYSELYTPTKIINEIKKRNP